MTWCLSENFKDYTLSGIALSFMLPVNSTKSMENCLEAKMLLTQLISQTPDVKAVKGYIALFH